MHYRIASICLLVALAFGLFLGVRRHPAGTPEHRVAVTFAAFTPPEPARRVAPAAEETPKTRSRVPEKAVPGTDREFAAAQARKLVAAVREGRLTLTVPGREGEQFEKIGRDGAYAWPPPSKKVLPAEQTDLLLPPCLSAEMAEPPGLPPGTWDALSAPDERPDHRLASRKGGTARRQALDADGSPATEPADAIIPPTPAVPSRLLMRMLSALAARSRPDAPLEIMTLLRPPYRSPEHPRGTPTNPHSLGLAADVAAYAGYRIGLDRPEDCVRMTLALLRDMPPGDYRLGLPKAPAEPLVVGQPPPTLTLRMWLAPAPSAQETIVAPAAIPEGAPVPAVGGWLAACFAGSAWPFFPAPEPALENGLVAPVVLGGKIVRDAGGQPVARIARYRNEEYAPEEEIADDRIRKALAAARRRGVNVWRVFPDAADHIHVDVKPPPAPAEASPR